jgi:oligopeptide transport system permease protein
MNRDYTLVMGMVIIYSTLLIGMGLFVDLLYVWLDPRIRFGR